jgi:hypothetical protein
MGSCNVLILECAIPVAYMVICLLNTICPAWSKSGYAFLGMPCILTASFVTATCHTRYHGVSLNRAIHLPDCAVMFIYTSFYYGLAVAYS